MSLLAPEGIQADAVGRGTTVILLGMGVSYERGTTCALMRSSSALAIACRMPSTCTQRASSFRLKHVCHLRRGEA